MSEHNKKLFCLKDQMPDKSLHISWVGGYICVILRGAEHSGKPKNATQKGHSNNIIIKKIEQNLDFLLCFEAVTRFQDTRIHFWKEILSLWDPSTKPWGCISTYFVHSLLLMALAFLYPSLCTWTVYLYLSWVTYHCFHFICYLFHIWVLSGVPCSYTQASCWSCLSSCSGWTFTELGRGDPWKPIICPGPLFNPGPYLLGSLQAGPSREPKRFFLVCKYVVQQRRSNGLLMSSYLTWCCIMKLFVSVFCVTAASFLCPTSKEVGCETQWHSVKSSMDQAAKNSSNSVRFAVYRFNYTVAPAILCHL